MVARTWRRGEANGSHNCNQPRLHRTKSVSKQANKTCKEEEEKVRSRIGKKKEMRKRKGKDKEGG